MSALTEDALKSLAVEACEATIKAAEGKDWDTMSAASYELLAQVQKRDLVEVKSFANPPVGVQMVAEGAMIALGIASTTGPQNSWTEFKKLLASQPLFLKAFKDFQPSTINAAMLRKLKPLVESPELQPESARKISAASAGIAVWIQALYAYGSQ
mmetsp:Transcript_997/g.2571  ORF Transcript_997/g.2571 Transcript_997/m.2571 type:complete len:155 (+) Transcript_997:33-497(+)